MKKGQKKPLGDCLAAIRRVLDRKLNLHETWKKVHEWKV